MKRHYTLLIVLLFTFNLNFAQKHFISDKDYRATVETKYQSLAKTISPEFFKEVDAVKKELTGSEQEAYEFLYAYMPLSDLADYQAEYFAGIVKKTFEIKNSMPWGKTVPEAEFRQFVLPVRINNSN